MSPTRAAVTAATSLGVVCDDPVVLHDGSNVVVHLRPAPVVARVATLTASIRPGIGSWFRRDALVARHLASRGVLATTPIEPAVHVDGYTVGLWRYETHDPSHVISPGEVATRLYDLHVALADLDAALPRLSPFSDLRHAFRLVEGVLPAAETLRTEAGRLEETLSRFPTRPLHGDAHPGNLLATPSGLMWNDFEDTWLGPLGWDLSCLATSGRVDGAAAVAAYPGSVPAEELDACVELRTLFGVVWRFVMATRFPARRAEADEHLSRWLADRVT
ncbi:phosphotransferase family protein [Actinophytocola oryzae]|uniref:phosphotransferase family protein n=1 Tax=Actinophytocola oryzae TaxID=502181 RepID=UPI001FBAC180|nr:phosphotransferase [Actinophytocola oryzae]